MKDSEKLQKIREILFDSYSDSLSSKRIVELADDIYDCAYTPGYDIADIFLILNDVDPEECGENSRIQRVFCDVVFYMDDNALTAQKLYDCLTKNFVDFDVLCKLLNWNCEWLSAEQIEKIKEVAQGFDQEILKASIRDWGDEE